MASERRLHPVSFIFEIAQTVKTLFGPLLGTIFIAGGRLDWEWIAALAAIPTAAIALLSAMSVRYRLDDREMVVRSGVFRRRVVHIPYERIQNVNAVQGLLHRLLDVTHVNIETGGGAEEEASLSVIDARALDELRNRIYEGRRPAVEAARAVSSGDEILRLAGRELLVLGLVRGRGTLIAAGIYGFLWDSGLMRPAQKLIFGAAGPPLILRDLGRGLIGEAPLYPSHLAIVLGGFAGLLLVFRLVSGFVTAFRYHGFSLRLDDGDLRMEYGLATRVSAGLPLRRIQRVTVYRGPLHRLSGYASVDVQTAAGPMEPGASTPRVWLAPLIKEEALDEFVARILPGGAPAWQAVDPRAVRRVMVRSMRIVLPLVVLLLWRFAWWGVPPAAALVLFAWLRASRTVQALRWSTAGGFIHFATGWIHRRLSIVPIEKVQAVSQRETPFDRRHRMRSIEIDIAGGAHGSMRMPFLPRHTAAATAADLAMRSDALSFERAPRDPDPGLPAPAGLPG